MPRRPQLLSIVAIATAIGACERPPAPSNRAIDAAAFVPTGGICGGTAGTTCSAPNDFCKKPAGQCNGQGVCTPKPTEVRYINAPVCGCDGKTYDNEDYAYAAGANVRANGACPSAPPEQPRNVALPSIQIVPEILDGGVRSFCRMADRPGGKDLIVRLRNPAPSSRPALNLSVGFTPNSTVHATSPAMPGSGTVEVRVPVPNSCLTGDCRFIIKVQDPNGGVQAEGSCLG